MSVTFDAAAESVVSSVEPLSGETVSGDEAVSPSTPGGAAVQEGFTQPQVRDPDRFTGHRVQLSLFEGPLDLLLYLIRAHRYDVCDIPIREITKQFLEFIQLMDELDLDYAGDFMVTAATLMQIKSRMLLPKNESANEEVMDEEAGNDPRKELVERLLEYQKFQEAADTLRDMREERAQMFARNIDLASTLEALGSEPVPESLTLQNVSSFDLLRALQRVLDRMAEKPVALVRREPFSIGERQRDIYARIAAAPEGTSFGVLCDDCQSRLEVVITFLALLELIRRFRVVVVQEEAFSEIEIRKRSEPVKGVML